MSHSTDDDDTPALPFYWRGETLAKVRDSRSGSLGGAAYLGYCDAFGKDGYRRLVKPDEPRSG